MATKRDLPPKIKNFITKPFVDGVNRRIDKGLSLRDIQVYLKETHNYSISTDYIGIYRKFYHAKSVEERALEDFLLSDGVGRFAFKEDKDGDPLSRSDKVKHDLDFIDLMIQAGANNLKRDIDDGTAAFRSLDILKAIELKYKLTEGATGGLTNFGIVYLQEITEEKYQRLLAKAFEYIPKDIRQEVMDEMAEVEHNFYKETDYYEEYLEAQGYTEKEIGELMYEREFS